MLLKVLNCRLPKSSPAPNNMGMLIRLIIDYKRDYKTILLCSGPRASPGNAKPHVATVCRKLLDEEGIDAFDLPLSSH